jgi:hypothetical protein
MASRSRVPVLTRATLGLAHSALAATSTVALLTHLDSAHAAILAYASECALECDHLNWPRQAGSDADLRMHMTWLWATIVADQVGSRACGCDHRRLTLGGGAADQPGGLLMVAITAYWQQVMRDTRTCRVGTW